MKRKAEAQPNGHHGKSSLRKRAKTVLQDEDAQSSFRDGLFKKETLQKYIQSYAGSAPYRHSVINSLINDQLLRSVRNEIRENVHFTQKETDIYKIHQSGDLANLDGLEDASLEKLPSLLRLRDVLYSSVFRKYIAAVTGSGELSGRKTDMAINVYTPGCHLLCHDDVIGSRRVSYILYLTDPDVPWKEEWGGALRLYPTTTFEDEDGATTKTPSPEFTKIIPPAWNQLCFFAVQPGESFHDVEEVYHAESRDQLVNEGGRIRMAISGWYHIPQIGEDGYVKGAEEKWGANSSLLQLQGHPDRYDFPRENLFAVEVPSELGEEKGLEEADLDFLLKYMAPTYLTPDTLEQVAERFLDLSSVTLDGILSTKFISKVREYVTVQEASPPRDGNAEIDQSSWKVARPPHKHRFLFLQPSTESNGMGKDSSVELSPLQELLDVFLPSQQFRRWLELATECDIENYQILARRFRNGLDYSLATRHDGQPRLEISLGLTPTPGWGGDEEDEDEGEGADEEINGPKMKADGKQKTNGNRTMEEQDDVGGHEVYMAADEDGDEVNVDAAVYKTSSDIDDDNVLFTMPASWNKMSIVLRDSGVLKFVKYVSKNAKGNRWDISGAFGVREVEEGRADEEEMIALESSDEEGVFNGFPPSEESDSD